MQVKIFYIFADNCKNCDTAISMIGSAIKKCSKISCEIAKFSYTSKAAIGIAVTNGINDLPGFVIGEKVFQGDNYSEKEIIDAIKEATKHKP